MSISFAQSLKKFQQAGIHPKWFLPIAPVGAVIGKNAVLSEGVLGKAPGRFNEKARVWSGLSGGLITNGLQREDFEEFAKWPTPNVGLLGRAYPGIDSDAVTDDARLLVEEVIYKTFGKDATFAERLRGPGPRRLYAFKCYNDNPDNWVRTRHISYRMPGDDADNKIDIIGYGGQYLITGIHPSGDEYRWHPDADLAKIAGQLTEITNDDMERFIETFREILSGRGGEIVRSTGGGGNGEEVDIRELEPVMPVEAVIEGLQQIPNSPDTFLHRDDFVSALAAIRAALGKASNDKDVEDAVFDWATKDPEWCDEEYFDKIWRSLDRVRVGRDSLDRLFRRNGVNSHIKYTFDNKSFSRQISKHKEKRTDEKSIILDTVASRYLFGYVNTRENQAKISMRDRWNVDREWNAYDWWRMELPETDKTLVGDLHNIDGYPMTKVGLANFLRDLHDEHADVWYSAEGRHPGFDKGEIIEEVQPDGNIRRFVNMRYLSPAIRHGRKADPDPQRSQKDVRHILDFLNKLFGPVLVKYELDTLAYMAQTGDRPGSLLFIVGESGVGKSIWMNMQMALFDGVGPDQSGIIDGSKLQNENARRFMFGKVEGCRILSIRELPEGGNARDMAAVTSQLKQLVDPGPEGDYVTVEAKGENPRPARNFARVLISSNYANAIHVEQYDRRIFYVQAKITLENKPDEDYYSELVNITNDPTRLAALWRYFMQREIGDYSRYTAPPISTEKAERIIAEIEQPHIRHMRAAMELLKSSDRMLFDTHELAELMSLMSEREHLNSGGEVAKITYDKTNEGKAKPEFMAAVKSIRKNEAVKLERDLRSSKHRPAPIYIMSNYSHLLADLLERDKHDILDLVEQECNRDYAQHPWRMYQKPERGG